MQDKEFSVILGLIVPEVIKLIIQHSNMTEQEATTEFYNSKVYSYLENKEDVVWHYSPLTLYNMYKDEIETGKITFPEGA